MTSNNDMGAGLSRIWGRGLRWAVVMGLVSVAAGCGGGSGNSSTELNGACAATTVNWTQGTETCQGSLRQGAPREILRAEDSALPLTGRSKFSCTAGRWVLIPATATCQAAAPGTQSMTLSLTATGRWYEYNSDAFTEIGRLWNNSPVNNGFFLTSSLPAYVPVGSGINQYPFGGNWNGLGTIQYNDTGYLGVGYFEAPITGVTANLDPYVLGAQSVLNLSYETDVTNASGMVQLRDGVVVGVNMVSTIELGWTNTPYGDRLYSGPFTITTIGDRDARFVLTAGQPANPGDEGARWDFSGTVNFP